MLIVLMSGLFLLAQTSTEPGVIVIDNSDDGRRCYLSARDGSTTDFALKTCSAAIAQPSQSARRRAISYVNRGVIHYNAGEYQRAFDDFSAAIEKEGFERSKVYLNRAAALEALSRGDPTLDAMARLDYNRALEIRPSSEVAKWRLEELSKPYIDRTPLDPKVIS